jgi:hypothetical protein
MSGLGQDVRSGHVLDKMSGLKGRARDMAPVVSRFPGGPAGLKLNDSVKLPHSALSFRVALKRLISQDMSDLILCC